MFIHPSIHICYMLSLINFHQKLFPLATSLFHTKFLFFGYVILCILGGGGWGVIWDISIFQFKKKKKSIKEIIHWHLEKENIEKLPF